MTVTHGNDDDDHVDNDDDDHVDYDDSAAANAVAGSEVGVPLLWKALKF